MIAAPTARPASEKRCFIQNDGRCGAISAALARDQAQVSDSACARAGGALESTAILQLTPRPSDLIPGPCNVNEPATAGDEIPADIKSNVAACDNDGFSAADVNASYIKFAVYGCVEDISVVSAITTWPGSGNRSRSGSPNERLHHGVELDV